MTRRAASRLFVVICTSFTAIAISVFALGGVASAHVVTSITADCYQTTVHFSGFPEAGVIVHIAVDVTGTTTVVRDVLVTDTSDVAQVDITAATATLAASTGNVDVDVTWTLQGPQHVHKTITVTCGSPTTTTGATTSTVNTTTTAAPTTTTTAPTTTTSVAVQGSTTVVTATTAAPTTTTTQVGAQGSTLPPTTTTVPAQQVLPRTGSDPWFPAMFGLSSVVAGALILLRRRSAWSR